MSHKKSDNEHPVIELIIKYVVPLVNKFIDIEAEYNSVADVYEHVDALHNKIVAAFAPIFFFTIIKSFGSDNYGPEALVISGLKKPDYILECMNKELPGKVLKRSKELRDQACSEETLREYKSRLNKMIELCGIYIGKSSESDITSEEALLGICKYYSISKLARNINEITEVVGWVSNIRKMIAVASHSKTCDNTPIEGCAALNNFIYENEGYNFVHIYDWKTTGIEAEGRHKLDEAEVYKIIPRRIISNCIYWLYQYYTSDLVTVYANDKSFSMTGFSSALYQYNSFKDRLGLCPYCNRVFVKKQVDSVCCYEKDCKTKHKRNSLFEPRNRRVGDL